MTYSPELIWECVRKNNSFIRKSNNMPTMSAEPNAAAPTSSYEGDRKNGRMEGRGTYKFPSGTVYTGQLVDGEFHGEGTLQYPGCGEYRAIWDHGKVVEGSYVFADGLAYTDPADGEWSYCRPDGDRRFYSELVGGLRPAGDTQLTNTHPPVRIPAGTYDTGDGYFNEADGKVYDYEGWPETGLGKGLFRWAPPKWSEWSSTNKTIALDFVARLVEHILLQVCHGRARP